jgi:GTPase SAR1 family protein
MGGICGKSMTPEEAANRRREKTRNDKIDVQAQKDRRKEEAVKKLLLLGAGESGKSTLFKQMVELYGHGYSHEEAMEWVRPVHINCLQSMQTLLHQTEELPETPFFEELFEKTSKLDPSDPHFLTEDSFRIHERNADAADRILDASLDNPLTPELANDIEQLWQDAGIQKTYDFRSRFQLVDSARYFFESVHQIAASDYVPSHEDIVHARVRTTGIVEREFSIDGNRFVLVDVGGQRNERKKWIHCFENVTAVIFVAALSAYDQVLFEDREQNRVTEALTLFDEICNSRWFREKSLILFLNKRDLFAQKIKEVPLTACPEYADFQGPDNDYEAATEYIQAKFESLNKDNKKEIYTHVTCATDKTNVDHVFNAVKDIVIRRSLRDGGLLFDE